MKRFIILAVLLIGVFIYAGHIRDEKIKILRIGTECDYTPNNWEEDVETDMNVPLANNEGFYVDGYDIQIAKIVANSIGAKLEVKKIPWQDLVDALNRHEIDAIFSGMLDTSERRKVIAFSDIYEIQHTEYAIVVHKDGKYADAEKLSDFIGASFVAQKDSNLDRAIAQIRGVIHLPPVLNVGAVFEKLNNHEADGTVLDIESAQIYERMYPGFVTITFPEGEGFKFDFTGICAGLRKNDSKLCEKINEALKDISKRDRQHIMDQAVARSWKNL